MDVGARCFDSYFLVQLVQTNEKVLNSSQFKKYIKPRKSKPNCLCDSTAMIFFCNAAIIICHPSSDNQQVS